MKKIVSLLCIAIAIFTSCGSHKSAVSDANTETFTDKSAVAQLAYVTKVYGNAPTANAITAKIDFDIKAMGQDMSVDGKLQMMRDKVIRITLSPLGLMEVGRLEFTPQQVLLVDRMNKQYVRASYNDLDFLRNNGLDFYSLQALFWNELFLPGSQHVSKDQLQAFTASLNSEKPAVTYAKDNFTFTWNTTAKEGQITEAAIKYGNSAANASTASWKYSDFSALSGKQFPTNHNISFVSSALGAKPMSLNIKLGKLSTDANWDLETTISSKYKQVSAADILKKLTNLK